ncbi:hypothetical protein NM208_g7065 [Fusarium decemcellulare]|uniref:Uncharacterized protein n=1 Tax=Fusarium decemcellulare TaxID=57161 RepID=A0ACC1SB07_9HYPO|nr:hypothetical protein NM208_g7065 [Fusarium decemcellulare]
MIPPQVLIPVVVAVASGLITLAGFGWSSSSPPSIDGSVDENLVKICRIHHRLSTAYPAQEPKTFYEYLSLDETAPPFNSDKWLQSGHKDQAKAHDGINKAWAKVVQRLLRNPLNEENEEGLYSIVAEALLDPKIMGVYVQTFMPKFATGGGKQRNQALKRLCGDEWKGE